MRENNWKPRKTWLVLTAKSRRALLPPSTPFYEPADTTNLLYFQRSMAPEERRELCSPCRLHCSFFPPPIVVHDISTMETARVRVLSNSTSFRTRLSNLLPTSLSLIPPCSPLIFPLLHLFIFLLTRRRCALFSASIEAALNILYPSSARFHFLFAKSRTRDGRRGRFPAVLSVNSFGFHDGGLLAFTVIAAEFERRRFNEERFS